MVSPTQIYEGVLDCQAAESPAEPNDGVPACGYKKCCPTVTIFDDGSVELTDDDAEGGSVGTIKMKPEVAKRLVELLRTPR